MKTLIIGGMHGNEPLGVDLVSLLKANPLLGVDTLIANPQAVAANTRFIDQDLNRVFPGKVDGDYEQCRAIEILAIAKQYDLVLDFHNTQANQPSCGFVGLDYDQRLLEVAAGLGIYRVIEAGYDCVNKYAPNCLSVEICMRDSDAREWYKKLKDASSPPTEEMNLYRFLRRVTWEESESLPIGQWQPFEELPSADKQTLRIADSACPIFIGSRFTQDYATLLEKLEKQSVTIVSEGRK